MKKRGSKQNFDFCKQQSEMVNQWSVYVLFRMGNF